MQAQKKSRTDRIIEKNPKSFTTTNEQKKLQNQKFSPRIREREKPFSKNSRNQKLIKKNNEKKRKNEKEEGGGAKITEEEREREEKWAGNDIC